MLRLSFSNRELVSMAFWKGGAMKQLSGREMHRDMTRLELRQAVDVQRAVQRFMHGNTIDEVSRLTGLPKHLVRKLNGGDEGYLWDCIQRMRRERRTV
jgi:hypothetical protein